MPLPAFMRVSIRFLLTLAFIFSIGIPVAAEEDTPDSLEGFQSYLDQLLADFGVPGAAVTVVSVDAQPRFFVSGVKTTGHTEPITPATSFHIASMTKSFSATLGAILVDENSVTWDTRVREVIPDFQLKDPVATENATLRDLLAHRTGMGRNSVPGLNLREDPSWWLPRLRYLEPEGEFRDRDHYSGVMVTVAGLMLERAAGTNWEELLQNRIFHPLGMNGTTIGPPCGVESDLAKPHLTIDGETLEQVNIISTPDSFQSGLYSTADDMARWLGFLIGGGRVGDTQIVSAKELAETWTPQVALRRTFNARRPGVQAYGLGWEIGTLRGQRRLSHGGGGAGSTSYIAFLPERGVGIAVLTNSALNPVPDLASNWIFNRIFGVDEPDPTQGAARMVARMAEMQRSATDLALAERDLDAPPPLPPAAYAGTYADFVFGEVEVAEVDGAITFSFHDLELKVDHLHENVFLFSSPLFDNLRSEFQVTTEGTVDSVSVPIGRNGTMVVFQRLQAAAD